MKAYIAGKLRSKYEREVLEGISSLCTELDIDSFLPHRDVGLISNVNDVSKTFEGDIKKGFSNVDIVIVLLDGLTVGAGTAWELGYAYAKNIPSIGLKTDEDPKEALEYLSAIILASTPIARSLEELKKELIYFKKNSKFSLKSL